MSDKSFMIFIITIMIGVVFIGWLGNDIYRSYKYEREADGMWLENKDTHKQAINTAYNYDRNGDWVCINTRDMTFKECEETAKHECGHEVFAEYCEDNWNKCGELQKNEE